jgi:putative membrane protein
MDEQNEAPRFEVTDTLGLLMRGVAMGAADVVPGVSGGTIAFISGIYERFINALRSLSLAFLPLLLKGDVKGAIAAFKRMHWAVLLPVGGGVGIAVLSMSKLITGLMIDSPGPTYAFFFGLILASAWIPVAHMKTRGVPHLAAALVAAAGAWLFVGQQTDGIEFQVARDDAGAETLIYASKLRDASDLSKVMAFAAPGQQVVVFDQKKVLEKVKLAIPAHLTVLHDKAALKAWVAGAKDGKLKVLEEKRTSLIWLFFCGLLAISAMVLPGLSGSFLLLFLGQYHAVFSAIHQTVSHALTLLGRDPNPVAALTAHSMVTDVAFVAVFGVGVLTGLVIFSRIVHWLFGKAHDITMAALTGIMIGALRQPALVVDNASAGAGEGYWTTIVLVAVAGAAVVTGLNLADAWLRKRREGVAA